MQGDRPLYTAKRTRNGGIALDYNLRAGKTLLGTPFIESPRSRFPGTHCELYKLGDYLLLHLCCCECGQELSVRSDQKRIDYSTHSQKISIEAMRCTHPGCTWSVRVKDGVAYRA